MTFREDAYELLETLPYELRNDVRQYVLAVDESRHVIFENASVELTEDRRQEFLYLVTLRKLWTTVDATFVGLRESVATFTRSGVPEIQVGVSRYGVDTDDFRELADLRNGLKRALTRERVFPLIAYSNLIELAQATHAERS